MMRLRQKIQREGTWPRPERQQREGSVGSGSDPFPNRQDLQPHVGPVQLPTGTPLRDGYDAPECVSRPGAPWRVTCPKDTQTSFQGPSRTRSRGHMAPMSTQLSPGPPSGSVRPGCWGRHCISRGRPLWVLGARTERILGLAPRFGAVLAASGTPVNTRRLHPAAPQARGRGFVHVISARALC